MGDMQATDGETMTIELAQRPSRPLGILLGFNQLDLGGSQLNALDLAMEMVRRGHRVIGYGTYDDEPGPLARLAQTRGLPLILCRKRTTGRASARNAARLRAIARSERIDVVHAYEFPVVFDCYYGPHLVDGVPMIVTIYSMAVPTWLPRTIPLVVGTQELADGAAPFRRASTTLIEPPVDTDADHAPAVDGQAWRAEHGLKADELALVIVSRLAWDMKAEGIERAIRAVAHLADPRVRLVIVGTGEAADHLRAVAGEANTALGYQAVRLPGAMADPRPAYAGADVVLGMGHSALRALSFGKPLVVLGENGFSLPFGSETLSHFLAQGFYGLGAVDPHPSALAEQIRPFLDSPALRAERGPFGRRLVVDRYSLRAAGNLLEGVYRHAVEERPSGRARSCEAGWMTAYRLGAQLAPPGAKDRLRTAVRSIVRPPQSGLNEAGDDGQPPTVQPPTVPVAAAPASCGRA